MGGSSEQVTGYKYVTNFLLFIGNPIEKVLGINFDNRGWLTPLIDEMKNPLSVGVVEKPTLYGENEGGVAGQIYAKYGTDNQQVVPFYKEYMDSKELPASAYPFQSYLAFKDFYVGNSGYMKEMLLWPKRIHVRNDGSAQWYDEKSAIDSFNRYEPTPYLEYRSFQVLREMDVSWSDPSGEYTQSAGGASFPMSELGQSYSAGAGYNGDPLPEPIGIVGAAAVLSANNMPADMKEGATLSPATWTLYPPKTDGFWNGAVTRYFSAKGRFYWNGGGFKYRTVLSKNGAQILISSIVNEQKELMHVIQNTTNDNYKYLQEEINLPAGMYELQANIGERYFNQGTPRPFLHLQVKFKVADTVDAPDINPVHKIREILTDDTAMNKPEASVNNINFMKAADRIYDEGLGVSWSITEKSCIDAINELCYHIESGIRVNRQTGLYEMVLFRDDWFEEDEIHTISESKIKSMQYEITNADEVINQVNVNYYDRANIKNSSFSISESGLIQTLGRVNTETLDFPYFMNMRNAEIVANWKLKQLSTGAFKGSFTTGWREARKWNRYDLIHLPWSKRWTGAILVRIMSINLGGPTNNEVSIDFIEVVLSTGMMNTSIIADEPIDKPLPPQACEYEPFEMPYYLAAMRLGQRQIDDELAYDNNFGLVGVVAEKPQENSLYAVMMTNNYDEWVRAGSIQYSLTADSDQFISKISTSFTVKNWKKISNVPAGTLIQCGKEWLTGLSEWMVFQSIDSDTGVVSVKRGALDTQPQDWDLGLKLYFCGADISYDQTEYVSGEKVLVSALTTTPSGVLEQKGSNQVEMNARAFRPYPPANVKINGVYWPAYIEGGLQITWSNRNRLQQTGGEMMGYFESSVALEPGVQTLLTLTEYDADDIELSTQNANVTAVNSFTLTDAGMSIGVRKIEITLRTVRDGYDCLIPLEHTVFISNLVPPANVVFEVIEL